MTFSCNRRLNSLSRRALTALLNSALYDLHWNLNNITSFKRVTRHPNTLTINPNTAPIYYSLSCTTRKAKF